MSFDFFAQEWAGICKACNTPLFAPTKSAYLINHNIHTHSKDCLGGY